MTETVVVNQRSEWWEKNRGIIFLLSAIVFCGSVGVFAEFKRQKGLVEQHHAIVAKTVDASGGTGLVRIQQTVLHTDDGACVRTIQQYTRESAELIFTEPPEFSTIPCSSDSR